MADQNQPIQNQLEQAAGAGTPQDPRSKPSATVSAVMSAATVDQSAPAMPTATVSSTEDIGAPPSKIDTEQNDATYTATGRASIIRPNQLLDLASFNYTIDLYVTSTTRARRTMESEKFYPEDWYRIISTVGGLQHARPGGDINAPPTGNQDATTRRPLPNEEIAKKFFTREYYIDDLEVKHAGGVKSTDTEINFRLVEPVGVSFFQEMFNFSNQVLGMPNFSEVPVMIVINFKGWDDNGRFVLLDKMEKYIPIKITGVEAKVNSTGTEYNIKCANFNDAAQKKSHGLLNRSAELEGKTLGELLLDNDNENKNNLEYILNQYQIEALKQDHTVDEAKVEDLNPHKYHIVFGDPYKLGIDLSQSILLRPDENPTKDTVMNKPDVATDKQVEMLKQMKNYRNLEGARNTEKIKFDKTKANFNQGVAVSHVIEQLINNSDYVTKQLSDFRKKVIAAASEKDDKKREELFKDLDQPMNWYRIVEKVVPTGRFNKALNVEQLEIYYYIWPIWVSSTGAASGTMAPAISPDKNNMVVKEYYYFFTGKNTEILGLDIDLSLDFFAYKPANPDVASQGSGDQPEADNASTPQNNNTAVTATSPSRAVIKYTPVPGGGGSSPGVGNRTGDRLYSKAVTESIYDNGAIMNTVSMEIMGDPDLLKQDGVFYVTTVSEQVDNIPVAFESHEKYVKIVFVSPQDINTETGLPDGLDNQDTLFNGFYKFQEVVSSFKQGKFTQRIELNRIPDTPSNSSAQKAPNTQSQQSIKPEISGGNQRN